MSVVLLIIIVVVVVVLVIYAIATYNGLVRRRNEVEESYRQIDVQLKRRYDLIPNLLEGVKKYFRQELSSTENKISFARQHYNDSVQSYNTKIQSFPAVIFSRAMGFTEQEYFEAQGPERESVTVSYD